MAYTAPDFSRPLDTLFKSSYSPHLTTCPKSHLMKMTGQRIGRIIRKLDYNTEPKKLIKALEKEISTRLKKNDDANFAVDFALRGEGNCVVFADIFVASLETIGRNDILNKLKIRYADNCGHVWLSYAENKKTIQINESYSSSRRTEPLLTLLSYNFNNLGVTLEDIGRTVEARAAYRAAIKLAPHCRLPRFNLEDSYDEGI